MIKKIILGLTLIGSVTSTLQANQSKNNELDLIKKALIISLQKNEDLQKELLDLKDTIQRQQDNIIQIASYIKSKEEVITLRAKNNAKEINSKNNSMEYEEISKQLSDGKILEITFIQGGNIREKASPYAKIIGYKDKNHTEKAVGIKEAKSGSIWYQLESGGYTYGKNVVLKIKEKKDELISSKEEVKNENSNNEGSKIPLDIQQKVDDFKKDMQKAQNIIDTKQVKVKSEVQQ